MDVRPLVQKDKNDSSTDNNQNLKFWYSGGFVEFASHTSKQSCVVWSGEIAGTDHRHPDVMEHLAQHEAFGWENVLRMFQVLTRKPNLESSGSG